MRYDDAGRLRRDTLLWADITEQCEGADWMQSRVAEWRAGISVGGKGARRNAFAWMHSSAAIAADWGGAEDIAVMTATGGDPIPEWAAGRNCGGSAVTQHGEVSAIRWGLGAHAETCSIWNKNGRHERVRTALVDALRRVLGNGATIKTEAAVDADGRACLARADNSTKAHW